jgi:ketosteroid isomerase-like protein
MAVDAETVMRGIEAYNAGDVEGMLEYTDPEITMVPVKALLEGGEYRGHDGVRKFLADMDEDWKSRRIEVEEIRDAGEDAVLVLGTYNVTGRSGTEVSYPLAWHSRFRDGKLWRMQAYSDRDSAIEAVGRS